MEKIHYTILEPTENADGKTPQETLLHIEYDDIGGHDGVEAKPVTITLGGVETKIDAQQLAELGALFIALAGTEVDYSGADAVLEGFDLKGKSAAKMLYKALYE